MANLSLKRIKTRYPLLAPFNGDYPEANFSVELSEAIGSDNEFNGKYELAECGLAQLMSEGLAALVLRIQSGGSEYDEISNVEMGDGNSFKFKTNTIDISQMATATYVTPLIVAFRDIDNLNDYIADDIHEDYQLSTKKFPISKGTILAIDHKRLLWEINSGSFFKFIKDDSNSMANSNFLLKLEKSDIIEVQVSPDNYTRLHILNNYKKYINILYVYMLPVVIELIYEMGYTYELKDSAERPEAIERHSGKEWYDYFDQEIEKIIDISQDNIEILASKILKLNNSDLPFHSSLKTIEMLIQEARGQ